MEWAAGNLLKQDWPRRAATCTRRPSHKINALSKQAGDARAKEAERTQNRDATHQQRDLIITEARLGGPGRPRSSKVGKEPSGAASARR